MPRTRPPARDVDAGRGVLLVGHGTRDQRGRDEFHQLADLVQQELADRLARPPLVEPCFLERAAPTIADGCRALIERGAKQITVSPVLLFSARHAKRDLPAAVWQATRGQVVVRGAKALECHPDILKLSACRFEEASGGGEPLPSGDTLLIVVFRGSSDGEAIAITRRFAEQLGRQLAVGSIETAYVAVANPTVSQAIEAARRSGFRRVVVQPHVLFQGEVLGQISAQSAQADRGGQQFLVAPHLGAHRLVARALVDLTLAAEQEGPILA